MVVASALCGAPFVGSAADVGDPAPGFSLPSANRPDQSLSELLEMGPVVVVFYRAFW